MKIVISTITLIVFIVLSLSFGIGAKSGRYEPVEWLDLEKESGTLLIKSSDDLQAKYDWLKSSDRDSKMGVLSATNRRQLLLCSGTYTIDYEFSLDTDFVDVMGLLADPASVKITRATGGSTIVQYCDDVRLYSCTVESTGLVNGDHGFEIDANDNDASIYRYMNFTKPVPVDDQHPVTTASGKNLGGLWEYCNGGNFSWLAESSELNGTFRYCTAGNTSFAGHECTGVSGRFEFCTAEVASFGGVGCTTADVTGIFIGCTSGYGSFGAGVGSNMLGTTIDCTSGYGSYGGYGANFNGLAINCSADYNEDYYSFGHNYGGLGIFGGKMINCRVGSALDYRAGINKLQIPNIVGPTYSFKTITPSKTAATTYTAWLPGSDQNNITIAYVAGGSLDIGVVDRDITITYVDSSTTAAAVEAAIDANGAAAALVDASDSQGGAVSGDVSATYLTAGYDAPQVINSHPYGPIESIVDVNIVLIYSGATYTNGPNGVAVGAVTFILPPAIPGFEYTAVDDATEAGSDVTLDGYGSEEIGVLGTTAVADDDVYQVIHVKCFKVGQWDVVFSTGTWD